MTNGNLSIRNVVESWRKFALLFLTGMVLNFAGCGGHDSTISPATSQTAGSINGNFNFSVFSQTLPSNNFVGGGLHTDATGHVSGLVLPTGALLSCFGFGNELPFAGSIDVSGHLSGTITSPNGQAMTMTGLVSSDGSSISGGTYTTSSTGCFAGDHGTFTGFQMQPFTGTYSGTFNFSPGITINLSIPLTQSTAPDALGFFEFAPATVTATGSSGCGMTTATFDPTVSFVSGGTLGISLHGSDALTSAILSGITTTNSTSTLAAALNFDLGPCAGQIDFGQLTRP